ncbi:hypothetical protein D3C81_1538860 [compost metagenome]
MTKDEYIQFAGDDLATLEEAAAIRSMTGQQLVERLLGLSTDELMEIDRNLGVSRNAAIAQVSGNVIQVNFSARAAASWSRRSYQAPSKRLHSANRVGLMPIRVPSTAPNSTSAAVPSTSPDTVIPYSSC